MMVTTTITIMMVLVRIVLAMIQTSTVLLGIIPVRIKLLTEIRMVIVPATLIKTALIKVVLIRTAPVRMTPVRMVPIKLKR